MKELSCSDCYAINISNMDSLSGNYSGELWRYFAPLKHELSDTNCYVKLIVKDTKRITAILYRENNVIESKNIRGKIKNGYFSLKPKILPIGLPPIYFWYYGNKVNLKLTSNYNLYIAVKESKYGMILLFIQAGEHFLWDRTYTKNPPI